MIIGKNTSPERLKSLNSHETQKVQYLLRWCGDDAHARIRRRLCSMNKWLLEDLAELHRAARDSDGQSCQNKFRPQRGSSGGVTSALQSASRRLTRVTLKYYEVIRRWGRRRGGVRGSARPSTLVLPWLTVFSSKQEHQRKSGSKNKKSRRHQWFLTSCRHRSLTQKNNRVLTSRKQKG